MAFFPPAPPRPLDEKGRPLLGAYAGSFEVIDLDPLAGTGPRGWLARHAVRKRWIYLFAASEQAVLGAAVVDLGYAGSAFAFALDRREGKLLFDVGLRGGPRSARVGDLPGPGARARFGRRGRLVEIDRSAERWRLLLEVGACRADVTLASGGAPAPFSLVAPVAPGRVNVTQKEGALAAGGWAASGERVLSLAGGLGGTDVTNGLLARRTAWRWAFAAGRDAEGRPLAFNLVSGFNEGAATEDVAFDGEGPRPLPPCAFELDAARPLAPWRVASADGSVVLRFAPAAVHREEIDAWLVRSRFVQVAGAFDGHLPGPDGRRVEVLGLPGVVEDQAVLW